MTIIKKSTQLSWAILCSLGLMVFSYFIQSGFPLKFISFAALALVAVVISRNLRSLKDLKKITGETKISPVLLLFVLTGIAMGLGMAVSYRWHLDIPLFPRDLFQFAWVAALIGIMEELVFRGYIQGQVRDFNGLFSILFSAFSHTGYKCCLFLSPFVTSGIDIGFLALWTFAAGIIAGILRHFSGSVWSPLIAHALFDILVYGEAFDPPWWVW